MQRNSFDNDPPAVSHYHHGDLRRSLLAAALDLLTETQKWDFSLREVARRAGVSHTAPYNHFDSKHSLLTAVAAAGYDLLRDRMQQAAAPAGTASAAFQAIGAAYVLFGVENPAHYRLMFGAALATVKQEGGSGLTNVIEESALGAKALLEELIRKGAEDGSFALSPNGAAKTDVAVLAAWSLVHGLTMLLIDGMANESGKSRPVAAPAAEQIAMHVTGLLLQGIGARR